MSVVITVQNAAELVDKGTIPGLSGVVGILSGANEALVDQLVAGKVREALDKEGVMASVDVSDQYLASSKTVIVLALGAGLGAALVLILKSL